MLDWGFSFRSTKVVKTALFSRVIIDKYCVIIGILQQFNNSDGFTSSEAVTKNLDVTATLQVKPSLRVDGLFCCFVCWFLELLIHEQESSTQNTKHRTLNAGRGTMNASRALQTFQSSNTKVIKNN